MPEPDAERFHQLVHDHIADPYPIYADYRDRGGLHCIRRPGSGREPEWLVLRYADAAAVLTGRGYGRRAGVAGAGDGSIVERSYPTLSTLVDNWLVFMDPPRHTKVRKIVADCFTARLRSGLQERIRQLIGELVEDLAGRQEFDLVDQYAVVVPMLVILEALGIPPVDREKLSDWIGRLQQGSSFRPGERRTRLATAEEAAGELDEYFRGVLASRRTSPRDDVMSALVAASWDEDVRTEELLVGTCVHLLASGHEATRNALSKSALLLLRNRDVLDWLRTDPERVPAAADELLRFDSPAQMITRWAYRDEVLAGERIHRGDKVTVVVGSANRDPARYAEPDRLRFDRENQQHCGFGLGTHYCLGSALGRMEVETGMRELLELLPAFRPAAEQVPYGADLVFHGPSEMRLIRDAA